MAKQLFLVSGKPGSGKTTVSELAAQDLGVYHFSMGEELRLRTLHGKPSRFSQALAEHAETLKQHLPLPADLLASVFEECIETSPRDIIIIDGYPQYPDRLPRFQQTLDDTGSVVRAICSIDVSDDIARKRMAGRADRASDVAENEAFVTKRLNGFVTNVTPTITVLAATHPAHTIDGSQSPETVAADLVEIIRSYL
ncbi:MAG: adk [Candidatus Saccharibacteria bacterium]|nr:adk [Candidatus Saccharibacteria bacterium]